MKKQYIILPFILMVAAIVITGSLFYLNIQSEKRHFDYETRQLQEEQLMLDKQISKINEEKNSIKQKQKDPDHQDAKTQENLSFMIEKLNSHIADIEKDKAERQKDREKAQSINQEELAKLYHVMIITTIVGGVLVFLVSFFINRFIRNKDIKFKWRHHIFILILAYAFLVISFITVMNRDIQLSIYFAILFAGCIIAYAVLKNQRSSL